MIEDLRFYLIQVSTDAMVTVNPLLPTTMSFSDRSELFHLGGGLHKTIPVHILNSSLGLFSHHDDGGRLVTAPGIRWR